MIIYVIFAALLFFVFAYYFAFEYARYKAARMLAESLGGSAVFKIGGSYMRRGHDGVEERAWIVPDDKMAWGSILSALRPPAGMLFLQRATDVGFRFRIEPKAGILYRTISLNGLKETRFNVPGLDESLRLRSDNHAPATAYFPEHQRERTITALFLAGFTRIRSHRGRIEATMKGISLEDLDPKRIEVYFKHLRSL